MAKRVRVLFLTVFFMMMTALQASAAYGDLNDVLYSSEQYTQATNLEELNGVTTKIVHEGGSIDWLYSHNAAIEKVGNSLIVAWWNCKDMESSLDGDGNTSFDIRKTTSAWSEASITWNTKPTVGTTVYGSYSGQLLNRQIVDIPINTSFLSGDGTYEMALISTGGAGTDTVFYSRQGSYAPQLIITYQ